MNNGVNKEKISVTQRGLRNSLSQLDQLQPINSSDLGDFDEETKKQVAIIKDLADKIIEKANILGKMNYRSKETIPQDELLEASKV